MRVLVPVDGTPPSHRAVLHAITAVKDRPDSHIILLNVQTRESLGLSDIAAEEQDETLLKTEHVSHRLFEKDVGACHAAHVGCETMAEVGPVADTIVRVAAELHADHIVMGTRGLNSLGGLLLGSVTTRAVHLAHVPVTLIK
jgi:nucleotide-binding universal stress UspA family protein